MDLYLEESGGRFVELRGICGKHIPWTPSTNDPGMPPCRLTVDHSGPHSSQVPRRVFDTVHWNDPEPVVVLRAVEGEPREIRLGC